MEKSTIFVLVVLVGTFANVNSLKCYECNDCPAASLKDDQVLECGAAIPDPSSTTPIASSTTPAASSTTPAASSTTPAASSTTPAASSTTPEPSSTTPAASSTTPAASSTTQDPVSSTTEAPLVRVRRHILTDNGGLNQGCVCYGEHCICDDQAEIERISESAYADNITYVCATLTTTKADGSAMISRGCAVPTLGDKPFCQFMSEYANATKCVTCDTDSCNNTNAALALQHSVVVLLFLATLAFFTK